MEWLLYSLVKGVIAALQALRLPTVARLGRFGGAAAYVLDGRHRRVALSNLRMCFGKEKSEREIHDLARENFKRLGENYCCAIKTAAMTSEELRPHADFVYHDLEKLKASSKTGECMVVAIGHFGDRKSVV